MPRGYTIAIGGAISDSSDILPHFVRLCGGSRARIAIIPTASEEGDTGHFYEHVFTALGVREARALELERRADGDDPDVLAMLDGADGVFFTGGNQLKLANTLGGTGAARVLRRRHAGGQHVAGTSAGAAFLSEHMIAFGDEGPTPIIGMVSLAPGLGLTSRIIIDQHFRQRDRLGRLLMAVGLNPFAVGIGLDEDTAAFISPEDVVEVRGSGGITVVDPSSLEYSSADHTAIGHPVTFIGVRLHILTHGTAFDLRTRGAESMGAGRRAAGVSGRGGAAAG